MKPIEIIGGGVAGLALGIGLRRVGVPVRIFEAGSYPRHRVCGEFISGAGEDAIHRMGLAEPLHNAGAREAKTCVLYSDDSCSPVRKLPKPAICISRYKLDAVLAEEFKRIGGNLVERCRRHEKENVPGRIWATGRRPLIQERGCVWYGLKVHASNVRLEADLEMHIVPDGYVGMCEIGDGLVNICGLFRKLAGGPGEQKAGTSAFSRLRGPDGSKLHGKLRAANLDEDSFCSVAGLGWKQALQAASCSVGDAFAVTPPITGNGMSIAFETAELAVEPVSAYSRGGIDWSEAAGTIYRRCQSQLSSRLRWARWLQTALMSSLLKGKTGRMLLDSDLLWRLFFSATRS